MVLVRQIASDLSGRSGRQALDFIAQQINDAERGADLAGSMAAGTLRTADAREQMSAIEHSADAHRLRLVHALRRSLTTPIDREDLYRLSRSVDDVVDNLRDYVRESDLYQPTSQCGDGPLLAAVATGMAELNSAVARLVSTPADVSRFALAARKQATQVRTLYQRELADLFLGDVDAEMLKRRELLRRLDVVALRMSEAADVLNDGMLKRSL